MKLAFSSGSSLIATVIWLFAVFASTWGMPAASNVDNAAFASPFRVEPVSMSDMEKLNPPDTPWIDPSGFTKMFALPFDPASEHTANWPVVFPNTTEPPPRDCP